MTGKQLECSRQLRHSCVLKQRLVLSHPGARTAAQYQSIHRSRRLGARSGFCFHRRNLSSDFMSDEACRERIRFPYPPALQPSVRRGIAPDMVDSTTPPSTGDTGTATSGSLRWRLLLGAAVAIFVAMALAWAVMSLLFSRHTQRSIVTELTREGLEIVAGLQLGADGTPRMEAQASDPRFERPRSGRYWQAGNARGAVRSVSLWDESLPTPQAVRSDGWSTREADGPFGQRLLLIERSIRLGTGNLPVTVQLGQNLSDLEAAGAAFERELGLFLAILWLALLLAAWLQVRLGLKPLAQVQGALASLQRNPAARIEASLPSEVAPLAVAINTLADARERDLVRAKRRGADLAHSLKTPLAALRSISHRARETGAEGIADDLDRVLGSAAAALETELARSRAAAIRDSPGVRACAPLHVAESIVGVVERTELGMRVAFDVEIAESLRFPLAEEDLMEILGALIENAARFARRRVLIAADEYNGAFRLQVEDDGPGLEISAEEALMRGGRLDETGHGNHGLGLSIAKDITEATGGQLILDRSPLGGLRVGLRWTDSQRC